MKRKLRGILLIIIFTILIIPTVIRGAEERKDYSVTIFPGEGSIKESPDSCIHDDFYRYVDCQPNQFKDIDSINFTVRENENIKNRIDYTAGFWANEGYITDTKIVKDILKTGINTSDRGTSGVSLEATNYQFGDLAYSTQCDKVYLFVPPENLNFSHFIDQDGNKVNINDTVTKDLILTPIYTEEETESVFMSNKVFNVTFLKGEGEIYYKAEYGYDNSCDGNVDKIEFQTYEGKNNFYDISQSYAKFRYSDYEKGIESLKKRKRRST